MRSVRERFAELAPGELVSFRRVGNGSGELALGDELEVQIAGVGKV